MGKLAKHCYQCGYIGRIGDTDCCEYCVITGRMRGVKQDENGILHPISAAECKHWREQYTDMRKVRPPMVGKARKKTAAEKRAESMHADMMALYSEGCNDREIADELRCSRSAVRRWRQKNGLPSRNAARQFGG